MKDEFKDKDKDDPEDEKETKPLTKLEHKMTNEKAGLLNSQLIPKFEGVKSEDTNMEDVPSDCQLDVKLDRKKEEVVDRKPKIGVKGELKNEFKSKTRPTRNPAVQGMRCYFFG